MTGFLSICLRFLVLNEQDVAGADRPLFNFFALVAVGIARRGCCCRLPVAVRQLAGANIFAVAACMYEYIIKRACNFVIVVCFVPAHYFGTSSNRLIVSR